MHRIRKNAEPPEPLRALAEANGFQGEAGAVLAAPDGVLFGVGDETDALVAAALSDRLPAGDYRFADDGEGAPSAQKATLDAYAWLLGAYRFDRYKSIPPCEARLVAPAGADVAAALRAAAAGALTRDLVNTPAGDMLPTELEAAARALADDFDAVVETIEGDALLSRNFPMIHAVGRASADAPRLIDLVWGRADAPKLTVVGKGVCFDSGGLNLKPGRGMALMKKDMGGAAHALGLARMIMAGGLDVRLRVLIPAVENAVSGSAFRPGDVLASRAGKTVEIGNTDAEGRLVLADALTYAGEDDPALVVTLATLTGAARVAVGPDIAPFYTDDEALAERIAAFGVRESDPCWRLPLWAPYERNFSSSVADMNNISNDGFAGSIVAALFLKKFAPPTASWAHFDIYAWRPKSAPGRPVGAEAQAIRALYGAFTEQFS
ncbi:MAG: leucyl aminopeptidase family protein [Pseudomonadota bacterium]